MQHLNMLVVIIIKHIVFFWTWLLVNDGTSANVNITVVAVHVSV